MAHSSNLPCDGDGICMSCKTKPSENETLTCKTCVTPWHVDCLSSRPEKLSDTIQWECPDCLPTSDGDKNLVYVKPGNDIVSKIRAIESDKTLSEAEKARRRQEVVSGKAVQDGDGAEKSDRESNKSKNDVLGMLGGSFNCSFCMQLPERPVTTPCGHNFCLKCFQKWVGQGKKNCAICRSDIPAKMSSQPRINSALVIAIRMAKMSRSNVSGGPAKAYHFVHNQNRPDKAYTTDRAKKSGKANACSGKIFVTVPPDHFGPISAEHDPDRSLGVMVGECWEDRMECRQWGAHLPHVAGIAGQSEYGAQSVALSGGYVDDEDHGEWFLYTGSGGRDLSGNKRTNKDQSFDQKFEKMNEALRVSCLRGYPVRVVRSHKEKRSSYAPETGVRYDGVYRIEKCWRKQGIQGFKVCRYLFVRCDNDPAPWTSDENGDRPRPFPSIKELQGATDVTERKSAPSWDYNGDQGCWMWKKPPPASKKRVNQGIPEDGKKERVVRQRAHTMSIKERLLKEFCCLICKNVMVLPLTTPCAHNFCKSCLEATFAGQTLMKERTCQGRRTLRAQKNVMKCPSCSNDISDYLQNPQVNRELMGVIESLQQKTEDMDDQSDKSSEETGNINEKSDGVAEETGAKTSEDAEELDDKSHEESEETDEKIDEVTGAQQLCVLTSETLEDVQKDILKPLIKTDTQETDQQTGNTGDDSSLKPDVADGGIKLSPIKPLTSDNVEIKEAEGKVKKVTKRKSSRDEEQQSPGANVGVRTRRQKTAACPEE